MDRAEAYLRLALVTGMGPVTARKLLDAVGDDPREIFRLDMRHLCAVDGVGGERARRILDPVLVERAEDERVRCRRAGIAILTPADGAYPRQFEVLHDPPLALWVKGELQERDRLGIAVVGPRRPSAYGHRQAVRFAGGLSRIGATVVSGLARGVDTAAHRAALEAGGRTVAVLGSGFDRFYPAENAGLATEIANARGAVLSEYPLDTGPSPGTFPRRNRLVAALSLACLVIEAGSRSGALITARLTGELGREVLVIPGPIDRPEHKGANALIRDGCTLVTSLDEVLEEVGPLLTLAGGATGEEGPGPVERSLTGRERQVYAMLDDSPRSVDDIHRISRLPPSAISATLISLELRRLARKSPGGYVRGI